MKNNVPVHIGIIMDGNRRWAKKQGLKVSAGHKEGVEALEKIVKTSVKLGIKYLTVYALSTENINERRKSEISDLFSLIKSGFISKLPILKKEGVKVKFFGDIEKLPNSVTQILKKSEKELSSGKNLQLNIAINYGSRAEILNSVQYFQKNGAEVNDATFSAKLYSQGVPDPDLIIRTGGMKRLSNFLLWQVAYSELYFTETLWPDFSTRDFEKALKDFNKRRRNFGG